MRSLMAATLGLALLTQTEGAWAQTIDPNTKIPITPPTAYSAAPYGARYYPGVGFRYVLPPSERVYGYYAGPRVLAYEARRYRRACQDAFWSWDRRCVSARDRW